MESSDTETGIVDCGVGTIVWVRRRNGSWWPGKILGPEELSASHLMSPRSGTPVKLLGREDASVDWYNLEKSKRVKPFRCGEFDDCIERAEASQGMPPKKREKYARREDAILHALELEKQLLEKKYGKLGLPSNGMTSKVAGGLGKEKPTSPELACDNGKLGNSKIDLSIEDKKKGPLQAQKVEKGSPVVLNDDNSDVRPRMRGLHDLGLSPVSSKHKLQSVAASNGSHKHAPDDSSHAHLDGLTAENTTSVNSKIFLEKRKRSHEGPMEESLSKRRDRRRPLVQVLESSAKLPLVQSLQSPADGSSAFPLVVGEEKREVVGHAKGDNNAEVAVKSDDSFDYKGVLADQTEISRSKVERSDHTYPAGPSEENSSGSTEDTETDSSGTESVDSDTDDAMTALSDGAEHIELIPKSFGRAEVLGEHESMSDEDADDLAAPDDTGECLSTSVTVSKWQLKGKRNSRNLTKRFQNVNDRKVPTGFNHGMSFKGEGAYGYDDADTSETSLGPHAIGYRSRGLDRNREIINWEDLSWSDQPSLKGYWEDSAEFYDPVLLGRHFGGRMKSMLIDVDLKVQTGYQREHVPMISLMSKLNGKAIVGHPIPVETLENGASEIVLSAADELQTESLDSDTTLQPWRTARRTAKCRVPRPPHLSTLDEEEASEQLQYVDHDQKPFGRSNTGSLSRKASTTTRKGPSAKFLKKPPKKISLSSNQKIRTLSSIGTQKHNGDLKQQSNNGYQAEGLIKPESLPTAVACIPVKLVFSRLHEELGARHQ